MVNGGVVNNWACLNFSRGVQDSIARGFCYELAQMCMTSGMVSFAELLKLYPVDVEYQDLLIDMIFDAHNLQEVC